jgi:protein-disulfide isomerase
MRFLLLPLLLEVIAVVNGETSITRAEIDAAVAPRLKRIAAEEEQIRRDVLQRLIDEKLIAAEASRRNISIEALLASEAPTREARETFVAALVEKAGVRIHLQYARTTIATTGRPAVGPPQAPVTIVVFSDFQCPFCRGTAEVLREVQRLESTRVRLVFRHFPLPMHDRAGRAAEAAECAAQAGRFWPVHDALFANPEKLSDAELASAAAGAGVDPDAFARCLAGGAARAAIDADKRAALEAGVEGTPAIFINGRRVTGPRTVAALRRLIAEESKGEESK